MFEETIKQILNNPRLRASNGFSLLGMDYDISHAFDSSDIFNVLEIKQKGISYAVLYCSEEIVF